MADTPSTSTPPQANPVPSVDILLDELGGPVVLVVDGRVRALNAAASRIFGNDAARLGAFVSALSMAEQPFTLTLDAPDGPRKYRVADPGAVRRRGWHLISLEDQTERLNAERALRENEARFRAIRDAALDAMIVMDASGQVCFWNKAAEHIFGWREDEVLGRDLHDIVAGPSERAAFAARAHGWARGGRSDLFGTIHRLPARHRDGRALVVELSLSAYPSGDGWLALGIVRDITQRAADETRLRDAEARWKFALEGAGDAVWDMNAEDGSCVLSANYKSMLGYREDEFDSSLTGILAHVHPEDLPRVQAQIEAHLTGHESDYRGDFRMRTRQGDFRWIHSRGKVIERDELGRPLRVVGTHRDVTEQHVAQEAIRQQLIETQRLNERLESTQVQLVQAEKLSSIGQLAAGVAHEMNSPLAFVGSNFGALEAYVGQLLGLLDVTLANVAPAAREQVEAAIRNADLAALREDLPALFDESRDGLERVRRIVRDLKDFSRVGEHDWAYCDLHAGIESTLNILRNEIKHKATVVRDFGPLPEIWCAPSQINQVLMNLIVNAVHAVDQDGHITLRTRLTEAAVSIEVIDDGPGIAPANLEHIFEPFFTTKPIGQGTGLGLSIAADIVRKHGGRLEVDSTPGEGCTFRIILPLSTPDTPASKESP
jgi:PAS domain S-box-containing protein